MSAMPSFILQRLEGFPQDLTDFEIPDAVDRAELTASLDSLVHGSPTPEARNCVVQVAAKLPPSRVLQDTLVQWSKDPGPSLPPVTSLVRDGLVDSTFSRQLWVRTAADGAPRARDVVQTWGAEHFDDLLATCNELFTDPLLRVGIVNILHFIVLRSPYSPEEPMTATPMYRLATHEIFGLLLNSLLFDTSNQLFALTLAIVVTILPFAVPFLTKRVPLLMVVLGRAVCWRDRPFVDAGRSSLSAVTRTPPPAPTLNWIVATTTPSTAGSPKEAEIVQPTLIENRVVDLYLTTLYGAWPSNVIGFTRNPPDYLATMRVQSVFAVPWNEVWEPGVVASRLLPLITDFQLHPSIISFSSMGEMQDEKRWDKYDPSEFVSMCLLKSNTTDEGMFEFFKMPYTRLDPRAKEMERVPTEVTGHTDDIGRLREENELLRLESLYADRIRKQLVFHIGRLHRNSMRFNIDEAELHTFVNRIKEQSKTIQTLTADLSQQRTDASQAQQKHVKWQKELRDKVSGFREERRNWQAEATGLRADLQEVQAFASQQGEELAGVKNERFVLHSQMLEATPQLRHLEDYKARIKQLTDSQLLWDSDVQKLKDAEGTAEALDARCAELEGMLRAREKICHEQANTICSLETRAATAPSIPPTPKARSPAPEPADATFYVSVAENARRRAEKLERENLELSVELERLRRVTIAHAASDGANSLLYGAAT